jgi:uncharacterized membrane protein YbhN (UPF0104 family)
MAAKNVSVTKARLKFAFYLVCLIFLIVLIVREHSLFADSLRVIGRVSTWTVAAGFTALLVSVLASSGVYGALSPRRLRFWRTALVQGGGLGVNRLLPAGSGALGVSYLYLRANQVGKAAAAATVAANNLLGFIGHALLLVIALAVTPYVFRHFDGLSAGSFNRWLAFAGVAVVGLVVVLVFARGSKLFQPVRPIVSRPGRLVMALSCSMLITICYVTAVLLAAGAIGYHLSLAAGLIVLSFGVAAASAVPVPGGIGAAEAGIFAGLHAYGANTQDALAIALLYRVMTFWLPLIVGGLAFIVVDRRGYLSVASKK